MGLNVLVTGAAGQLGAAIEQEFARDAEVVALAHASLDITDREAVMRVVAGARPSVIINCAAFNDVDGAEDQAETALRVNALAVQSLARAATAAGAVLVHYGTDFVFDGAGDRPYTEDDRPNPASVYAASKLVGEWLATDAPRHYVLRVESLFGGPTAGRTARAGSLGKIVASIMADEEVPVFTDRVVSPSYAIDVARATRAVIERQVPPGLYHCVNSGHCTWHELGGEIARLLGRTPRLKPVTLADVKFRAARPKFCALSNAKLASRGVTMPTWQDALGRLLRNL